MGGENKGTLFFLERNTLFRIQKNEIRDYHKMLCIKHPRIFLPLKKYRFCYGLKYIIYLAGMPVFNSENVVL